MVGLASILLVVAAFGALALAFWAFARLFEEKR